MGLQLARVGPHVLDLDQSRIHKESFVAKPFSPLGGPPPFGQNSGIWSIIVFRMTTAKPFSLLRATGWIKDRVPVTGTTGSHGLRL